MKQEEKIYKQIIGKDFINADASIREGLYRRIASLLDNKKTELSDKIFKKETK